MRKPSFLMLALSCVTFSLMLAPPLFAQDGDEGIETENKGGGPLYAGKYDAVCERINKKAAKESGKAALLSFAFFDPDSNANMCLNVQWIDDPSPQQLIYQLTDMQGALLDALAPPMTSSSTPLEGCNLWDAYFDDYNKDGITDITLMIGCAPTGNGGTGRNDNAVYLSVISEGAIWLRQRQDLNKAVAAYAAYDQVEPVIRAVLSGKRYPRPPSSPPPSSPPPSSTAPPPPPPPPPPAPPGASAQAPAANSGLGSCYYSSNRGPVTLTFDEATGKVTGAFGEQGGSLSGRKDGIQTRGVWSLGKDKGEFEITHETWGFMGNWKRSGDAKWRGEWEGDIINCD